MTIGKIRKINSFVLAFGIIYLIQNYTIGQMYVLKNTYICHPILLKELIFIATSITLNFIIFDWRRKKNGA